ncbi:hypothetical protein DL93DRAFT_2174371 [Clavulina sp. PMI_390]|nr:hypothetical protein DL93DRAFT_2174371 [Clavulina sp. PMI_390]
MSTSSAILSKETTVEKLDAAMEFMSIKGRGPAPKDLAVMQAWMMSNIHGLFISMLKQIYVLGPNVKTTDHDDFVKYGLMWCSTLHAHHHEEEQWYFRFLDKAIQVETIEKEHARFTQPLQDIEDYLISCLPSGSAWGLARTRVSRESPKVLFDGATLNTLIDAFVPNFLPHFCDEISYLDAAKLRAAISEAEFQALMRTADREIGGQPAPFHVLGAYHSRNPAFPPAPWFVINILIPWVFYWPDRRLWRFAPSASYWE